MCLPLPESLRFTEWVPVCRDITLPIPPRTDLGSGHTGKGDTSATGELVVRGTLPGKDPNRSSDTVNSFFNRTVRGTSTRFRVSSLSWTTSSVSLTCPGRKSEDGEEGCQVVDPWETGEVIRVGSDPPRGPLSIPTPLVRSSCPTSTLFSPTTSVVSVRSSDRDGEKSNHWNPFTELERLRVKEDLDGRFE